MTDQDKSKVLCERVGIEFHELKWNKEYHKDYPHLCSSAEWECIVCGHTGKTDINIAPDEHLRNNNPNLFTPEGQAILAQALMRKENKSTITRRFIDWLDIYFDEEISYQDILKIIAETKLAELFYEFIESEKKDGTN